MDLRQLRYFVQIADCGSFSRAAEMLRVAQPSLSQQIKSLEEELGVELFMRHARGVALTELGLQFCDHARRLIQEADHARDSIRSQAASPSGRVSVGLPTSACRGLSLPLFQALSQRLPHIRLHIVETMTGYLDELLRAGRLDVALLYDHKAFEHVAWTEMMAEELMLLGPPDGPLTGAASVPFRQVFEQPLVLPGRPNVARILVERLASRQDIEVAAMDCDSLPAIAQLVRFSGFHTILPHFALATEIERGEMAAIPIVDPAPSWRLSVVVSQRTLNPRGSDGVARVLAEVIADLVDRGVWRARLTAERPPGGRMR
ncbi:LysR family transcriptional regulator [Labrys monachus]|uniref:DNA-binding transcriptional LysR family regulator n=1 Tax=Labrys monachus TaxID=217067 RepID=A0ABU0FEC1_9HYPH|nr:LysR family transcriptional regulator [Labrys monachus]MDQ0392871.1 DNA-binding transcriptional LysR family regulator [Labrys monachus]